MYLLHNVASMGPAFVTCEGQSARLWYQQPIGTLVSNTSGRLHKILLHTLVRDPQGSTALTAVSLFLLVMTSLVYAFICRKTDKCLTIDDLCLSLEN